MEKFLRRKKLYIYLLLFVSCLFFSFSFTNIFSVNAEQTYLALTNNEREYYSLSSPIDAYVDDEVVAIIQGGSAQNLLVHTADNGFRTMSGVNLKQVKKLNTSTLIVSDSGRIKKVDIATLEQQLFDFDQASNNFGGTFFDLNNRYLITSYSTQLDVYRLSGDEITNRHSLSGIPIAQDSPVAINDADFIFYVVKEGTSFCIYKRSLTESDSISLITSAPTKPTSLIANNEFLFYISGSQLVKVDINEKTTQRLLTEGEKLYELGYLTEQDAPTNISFNGKNLIITDSYKEAIEEFSIEDSKLIFTGFAVAKDKTAFNRIQKNAFAIRKSGDKIVVADSYKTSIISAENNFDYYSLDSYENYLTNGNIPSVVAFGKSVLLGFKSDNTLKFAGSTSSYSFGEHNLKDVCYQNENYYVLTDNGTHTKVFVAKDNGEKEVSELEFIELMSFADVHAKTFTVDVCGNVYCYDSYNVYKNGQLLLENISLKLNELATDLVGNLFAISDNKFIYLDNQENEFKTIAIMPQEITSFAMDYVSNRVYFLLDLNEFIYYSTSLDNVFINGNILPDQFIVTDSSTSLDKLDIYTLQENQNAYKIIPTSNIEYVGLAQPEEEYLKICDIKLNGVNGENTFGILVSATGITIVNDNHLTKKQVSFDDAPTQLYVATAVNAYYLPVLTPEDIYVITENEIALRLEKETPAIPTHKFNFLGVEFYFATLENNKTVFIPANFTVETLSKDYISTNFTIETVKDTTVYAFSDLTGEIATLNKGDTIKVKIADNSTDYATVYLETDDGMIMGYIAKSAIINAPNTAIRNLLVVLAAIACVAGSVSFFLLRSKQK